MPTHSYSLRPSLPVSLPNASPEEAPQLYESILVDMDIRDLFSVLHTIITKQKEEGKKRRKLQL